MTTPALPERAGAAESLSVGISLPDAAGAAEALTVVIGPYQNDGAGAVDDIPGVSMQVAVSLTVTPAERAAATDGLIVAKLPVPTPVPGLVARIASPAFIKSAMPVMHLQNLITGKWLHRDVQGVSSPSITWALNAPDSFSCTLGPPRPDLLDPSGNPVAQEWRDACYLEEAGKIKFGGILTSSSFNGPQWQVTFTGFMGYPNGTPYEGPDYSKTNIDALDVVRYLWSWLQGQPQSNIGLDPDSTDSGTLLGDVVPAGAKSTLNGNSKAGSTVIKVHDAGPFNPKMKVSLGGGAAHIVKSTSPSANTVTLTGATANYHKDGTSIAQVMSPTPYQLFWYNSTDIGQEIGNIQNEAVFDMWETHAWTDAAKSGVSHRMHFGVPRAWQAAVRPALRRRREHRPGGAGCPRRRGLRQRGGRPRVRPGQGADPGPGRQPGRAPAPGAGLHRPDDQDEGPDAEPGPAHPYLPAGDRHTRHGGGDQPPQRAVRELRAGRRHLRPVGVRLAQHRHLVPHHPDEPRPDHQPDDAHAGPVRQLHLPCPVRPGGHGMSTPMSPQLAAEMGRLARQLTEMQARITQLERGAGTVQLDNASIEGGALTINDADGNPAIVLGLQEDGTYAHAATGSGGPPPPSDPVVVPLVQSLMITWDGSMAGGTPPLADLAGVQVHVSTDPGFVPGPDTLQSTFISPGVRPVVGLIQGLTYYVALVTINAAGVLSEPSNLIPGIPMKVADQIGPGDIGPSQLQVSAGGIQVTIGPVAPTSPHTGDLWFDQTNDFVMKNWDGTQWVASQFGTGAITAQSVTADLVAANAITTGLIAAGAIDGMTVNAMTIAGTTITGSNLEVSGAYGGMFVYSTGGQIVVTYTASGSWTAPSTVTAVKAEGTAPGGGGMGGYNGGTNKAGVGGNGGEYAAEPAGAVTPGLAYPFTIPVPGSGGTVAVKDGGNAGSLVMALDAVTLTAHGGGGGKSASGGTNGPQGTGSTNTVHRNGGLGWINPSIPNQNGGGGAGEAGPPWRARTATATTGRRRCPVAGPVATGSGPGQTSTAARPAAPPEVAAAAVPTHLVAPTTAATATPAS